MKIKNTYKYIYIYIFELTKQVCKDALTGRMNIMGFAFFPANYQRMFCITIEHKSSCDNFLIRYCKNIISYFGYFEYVCPLLPKNDNVNFRNVDVYLHAKKELHFPILF